MGEAMRMLEARIQALEDREAIRQLKSRYLRACDLKDVETIRDCFDPEGVRIAYQGFPEFTRRDDFVETYRQMACQPGVYDIHHATNSDIEFLHADEARGRWSLNFRTILAGPRQITRLAVEYEDVYRHRDGRWYIAETVSAITSAITEQVDEDGGLKILAFGPVPDAPAG